MVDYVALDVHVQELKNYLRAMADSGLIDEANLYNLFNALGTEIQPLIDNQTLGAHNIEDLYHLIYENFNTIPDGMYQIFSIIGNLAGVSSSKLEPLKERIQG